MSWFALLLIGIGLADLGHSMRPRPWLPECLAAGATVVLGLLAGLTRWVDVLALLVIAGVVVAWGRVVRYSFGRDRAAFALSLFGAAFGVTALLSPLAGEAHGWLGDWLHDTSLPVLDHVTRSTLTGGYVDTDRFLLVLGGLLVQCSTGNVIVRLVLAATKTTNPAATEPHHERVALKGGRLLGPMERLVILGFGLSGNLAAASIVIAAKSLIRWPEIQSFKREGHGPSITDVTEYFLVGSFVSWMVSFATLFLLR